MCGAGERPLHGGVHEGNGLLRKLLLVWLEFERRLGQVPIVKRLAQRAVTVEEYRTLLRNLRPQVVEGARWITRAASSFGTAHLTLRSAVIRHAQDEHRDFEMLEHDYVTAGGQLEEIRTAPRNIGTEALCGFMMNQASQADPIDLLGAMFIIEGLGQKMASEWAVQIEEATGFSSRFLTYHGKNDEGHLEKLHTLLADLPPDAEPRILKTARVVARLYALQLEEMENV